MGCGNSSLANDVLESPMGRRFLGRPAKPVPAPEAPASAVVADEVSAADAAASPATPRIKSDSSTCDDDVASTAKAELSPVERLSAAPLTRRAPTLTDEGAVHEKMMAARAKLPPLDLPGLGGRGLGGPLAPLGGPKKPLGGAGPGLAPLAVPPRGGLSPLKPVASPSPPPEPELFAVPKSPPAPKTVEPPPPTPPTTTATAAAALPSELEGRWAVCAGDVDSAREESPAGEVSVGKLTDKDVFADLKPLSSALGSFIGRSRSEAAVFEGRTVQGGAGELEFCLVLDEEGGMTGWYCQADSASVGIWIGSRQQAQEGTSKFAGKWEVKDGDEDERFRLEFLEEEGISAKGHLFFPGDDSGVQIAGEVYTSLVAKGTVDPKRDCTMLVTRLGRLRVFECDGGQGKRHLLERVLI